MTTIISGPKLSDLANYKIDELNIPKFPRSLYEPVKYSLKVGGKRLRFTFALLGCGLCNGNTDDAVPAAVAIELLHNFTLLHDDVMDGADTRRGKPSVYKKWDTSTAILSGDIMFVKALEQLQQYKDHNRYFELIETFLSSTREVCEGQALDLEFEKRIDINMEDYMSMVRGKTAALIKGSLLLGGIVAGADQMQKNFLAEIGNEIGIAFQIQDDLLDVNGDPEKFGKKWGGDIYEGKRTFLYVLAMQRGNKFQKDFINSVLLSNNVTDRDVQNVVDIYNDLNIYRSSAEKIKHHYTNALECLEMFPITPYRNRIGNILYNLMNRDI